MHMHTCIYISPQLVHARLCNGAAASLPWKLLRTYLESCANIVQAVVSAHPPAPSSSRPPYCWPVARHVRLRNPIKSTLAHDAVAAVVLYKHHLIIRVGAGLIQFVYGSHLRLAVDLTLDKNPFPLAKGIMIILVVFLVVVSCYATTQLVLQLQQERTQVVCSNRVARKRPARRHSRNSCQLFVCIVVCACSRHALGFKRLFFGSFVSRKGYCVTYFM